MSTAAALRGGAGGLLAAALFIASTVIDQVAPVQSPYLSATDYAHQVVLVLAFQGAAGAVLGLALLLRGNGRFGRLTAVGATLAGAGYFLIGVLGLANLVQGERVLVGVRRIAAVNLLVGSVLLGVLVLITRVVPWWCGLLLIVAFPLGDAVNELFRGGEGIMLALLWGSVGAALLARAGTGEPNARPTIPWSRSAVS